MNKTTVTKLPKSKVELTVQVPAEELEVFVQKALDEFTKEAEITGFRKGMAPKEIVKNKVGQARIMDRAASLAIEATFPAAVTENSLEPMGYPEINILKLAEGNPLEYKAVIAVYPHAQLPDYKQIASGFQLKEAEVTDDDIKRLKMEKERHLREHLREDVLNAVAEKTVVEIPEILIERETEKMMGQLKDRTPQMLNMSFEDYLKKLGKTESELRDGMAKDNELKIKNYIVLAEIAKAEKIEANDAEIAAAMKKEEDDSQPASAEGSSEVKEYYRETLKTEKTFEFLESLFKKS